MIGKAPGPTAWTITTLVREWLADPASNFGLLLNADTSKPQDRYRYFASMEHGDASLRPFLRITVSRDDTPPSITSTAASGVTASAATITWTTDEPSDSQVEYGADNGVWQRDARATARSSRPIR